ncbi:MAG TPA: AraC family transcriptional regulator [Firmicutes bacterium]|nr:AraC family transcriptional regulator [Bacillota bacterium]
MEPIDKALAQIQFQQQEENRRHHTYDEELLQYEYMKNGNQDAVPLSIQLFQGNTTGKLSEDPLRNYKYLFVASITLCCRFCIEGGMPAETAYALSDLYIQQVDKCPSIDEIFSLHTRMFTDLTQRMANLRRESIYSRPVLRCLDYIDLHLHEKISVQTLANYVNLTPPYLSSLFGKETGTPISEYIRKKRVETAKTLLQYSEYSCIEIANYLSFSSHSHFNRVFKYYTGLTPNQYRLKYFRHNWT